MGDPILSRAREMESCKSGPCIIVVPADPEKLRKRQDLKVKLIEAIKNKERNKFVKDNNLSDEQVRGMHSSMLRKKMADKGEIKNKKGMLESRNFQEYLKYAEELYHEGMGAHDAIAKAKKTLYRNW